MARNALDLSGVSSDSADGRHIRPSERALPDILDALRWRWKTALLIAGLFALGAILYVESLPAEYDGRAIVAVGPRPEVQSAGADTVRVIAPKYVVYITAPATVEEVARELGQDAGELDEALQAGIATDTGNISITVRLESPRLAASVANAFAQKTLDFAEHDPLLAGQLVAPALPPGTAAAPPRRLLEGAAVLVGLLAAVGVAVLLERVRPRLRSWREMTRLTGYPVVGRIPMTRAIRAKATEAFADPATGSAFRSLRANLEPQLRDQQIDLIVVTSPTKGDGKTTVAALFAESLARVDMRVLLVDADLHRPRIGAFADLQSRAGLSLVLRRSIEFDESLQPGWTGGLSLLPTTPDSEGGDLLATRFADVVSEARRRFDVIVVDTAPLIGIDDARTLLTMATGVLLVVGAGSHESEVNEALLAVEALHAPMLGIIANKLRESRPYYY